MDTYKILVPVDFSEHSRQALDYATFLARHLRGALHLVYVWPSPTYVGADMMVTAPGWNMATLEEYAHAQAKKDFEKLTRELASPDIKVSTRIEVGRPASEIVRIAAEGRADLIVMGTHGHSGLSRLLLGSVAQEVVAKAPCPVVTVKRAEPTK